MRTVKVEGKNKVHKVLLYTLSTCIHCRIAKDFFKENDVEFEYIDVDLCDKKDQQEITGDILRRGSNLAFPKIIIDDDILITGFDMNKIKEIIKI